MKQFIKTMASRVFGRLQGQPEAGMVAAEYAVGTVTVLSILGILWKILSDPNFLELLWQLIRWLIQLLIAGLSGGAGFPPPPAF